MVTRVLVVDDSGFFRRRIVEILEADARIRVVGTAANGKEAVAQVASLKPDVVTMDIEMPVMDGMTALRHIMSDNPTPVVAGLVEPRLNLALLQGNRVEKFLTTGQGRTSPEDGKHTAQARQQIRAHAIPFLRSGSHGSQSRGLSPPRRT